MPIRMRGASGLLMATGLALLLPFTACTGDDTPPYPVIEVTPVDSVRSLYASGGKQNFASGEYMAFPIELTVPGYFDITVDWTFSSSWIYVYFGNTLCTYDELAAHTCPFLISSETRTPKPRTLNTEKLAAGKYYLVLYNVPWDARTRTGTDNNETVVFTISLTITASSGERLPVQLGQPVVIRRPGR